MQCDVTTVLTTRTLDVVAHAEFGSFYVLEVAQPRDVGVHFADDEIEVGVSHQLRGGG